jgi:RNA recognition motif-containing protein
MSELYHEDEVPQRVYWDRRYYNSFDDQLESLKGATTLYVGNLSFYTTEFQIHETFSRVGPVKRIIMGLNKETKAPCGFCFVEYYTYDHACACLKYISGTMCDGQIIRCELDGGFKPGRQFGRGKSGGQVRDERRLLPNSNRPVLQESSPLTGAKRGREVFVESSRDSNSKRERNEKQSSRDLSERLQSGLSSSRGSSQKTDTKTDTAAAAATDIPEQTEVKDADSAETHNDRDKSDEEDEERSAKYRRVRNEDEEES